MLLDNFAVVKILILKTFWTFQVIQFKAHKKASKQTNFFLFSEWQWSMFHVINTSNGAVMCMPESVKD